MLNCRALNKKSGAALNRRNAVPLFISRKVD